MSHVSFTYDKALKFFDQHEVDYLSPFVESAHHMLHEKTGPGNDFLGWIDLPENYDKEEFIEWYNQTFLYTHQLKSSNN